MDVMGVTAQVRTPISCGVGAAIGSSRNVASRSQLFAQKKQQRVGRKVEVVAVEGGVLKSVGEVLLRHRGNVFLGGLAAGLARVEGALAVSYDDIVQAGEEAATSASDSVSASIPSIEIPDLNLDVDTSGLTDFIADNPLAIVGGLVVLALPVIATNVFKKPSNYGTVSAEQAFEQLGDPEAVTQILDIRVGDDIRSEGTPDLRKFRKKVTQIPYNDEAGTFAAKVLAKFKDAENTTLYVMDRFDGKAPAVAKLLVQNGFKAAYSIKDGAEGPTGWQSSKLPWLMPRKGFSLDLSSLKDVFDTGQIIVVPVRSQDNSSLVPATLGVAAAAGVGLVVFSEAETALQLLGSAALVQIFVKKLLFAKDRKKTFEELQTFLDTKIAPKELVSELQGIGKVLLPKYEEVTTATVNGAATLEKTVEKEAPALVSALSVSESAAPAAVVDSPAPAAPVDEPVFSTGAPPAPAAVVDSPAPAAPIDEPVFSTGAPPAPAAVVDSPAPAAPIDEPVFSTGAPPAPTEVAAEAASVPEVEEKPAEKELVSAPSTKSTDLPRTNRPLSPYTQFPGMKPPPPPSKP